MRDPFAPRTHDGELLDFDHSVFAVRASAKPKEIHLDLERAVREGRLTEEQAESLRRFERKEKGKERAAHTRERRERMRIAWLKEELQFQMALDAGAQVFVQTCHGRMRVTSLLSDHWWRGTPTGVNREKLAEQAYCGANDGTWASMLEQAGIPREPEFA